MALVLIVNDQADFIYKFYDSAFSYMNLQYVVDVYTEGITVVAQRLRFTLLSHCFLH